MRYIRGISNEPAFNLAMEDYFLDQSEEYFMLWVNKPSVIIGINQNAMAEIDYDFVKENDITVARRISGGGAVFHDLGNINFTYLVTGRTFGDYESFTTNLLKFLNSLGCPAQLMGRNDLMVEGMKFSGNAQCNRKDRMMHHGCILFDTKMEKLVSALRPDPEKIASKGIASVRKRVCNLRGYIDMTAEEFFNALEEYMIKADNLEIYEMTDEDIKEINSRKEKKFSMFDWVYGVSPKYTFHKKKRFDGGSIEAFLDVERGVINSAKIFGDFFAAGDISIIENALSNIKHEEKEVEAALEKAGDIIKGISISDICTILF